MPVRKYFRKGGDNMLNVERRPAIESKQKTQIKLLSKVKPGELARSIGGYVKLSPSGNHEVVQRTNGSFVSVSYRSASEERLAGIDVTVSQPVNGTNTHALQRVELPVSSALVIDDAGVTLVPPVYFGSAMDLSTTPIIHMGKAGVSVNSVSSGLLRANPDIRRAGEEATRADLIEKSRGSVR